MGMVKFRLMGPTPCRIEFVKASSRVARTCIPQAFSIHNSNDKAQKINQHQGQTEALYHKSMVIELLSSRHLCERSYQATANNEP